MISIPSSPNNSFLIVFPLELFFKVTEISFSVFYCCLLALHFLPFQFSLHSAPSSDMILSYISILELLSLALSSLEASKIPAPNHAKTCHLSPLFLADVEKQPNGQIDSSQKAQSLTSAEPSIPIVNPFTCPWSAGMCFPCVDYAKPE